MRRLLAVIDYQNDFVSGSLGFEGAKDIEPKILELIKEFKENDSDTVCFTKDTHGQDYLQTIEGQNLPIKHCIKGTWGWELTDKVKEQAYYCPVFEKWTFPSKDLLHFIEAMNFDEIYIVGLVSDICVFTNAIIAKAAANPYAKVIVIKDAIGSSDKEMTEKALDLLKYLHIEVR